MGSASDADGADLSDGFFSESVDGAVGGVDLLGLSEVGVDLSGVDEGLS